MNKREGLKKAVKISPKNGEELVNHDFNQEVDKPKVGTLCTIISKHKKYIGESGYICGYHQDGSSEVWVKLDNYDLQLRCTLEQISISLKNHRGFEVGDRIQDTKNDRCGNIKILREGWLIASWDNGEEGVYYYEYIRKDAPRFIAGDSCGALRYRILSNHPIIKGEFVVEQYPYKYSDDSEEDYNFVCTTTNEVIRIDYLTKIDDCDRVTTEKQFLREIEKGDRIFSNSLKKKGLVTSTTEQRFFVEWDGFLKLRYHTSEIEQLELIKDESPCSTMPACLQESEDLNSELKQPEQALKPESSLKTTQQPSGCLTTDSQASQSTAISETTNPEQDNSASTQLDSPAQVHQLPVMAQGSTTQNQISGLKPSGVLLMAAPASSSSKILQGLSTKDYEQFLGDSEWSAISGKIRKSYQQRNSERPTKESGCSLLPTPTTYPKGSGKCRPAGTNRLEQRLSPYITKGDKLHPAISGWMMGFPPGWVEQVLADTGEMLSIQVPLMPAYATISTTAATALTCTVEQLHHNKQQLQSDEFVTLPQSLESLTTTEEHNQQLEASTVVKIIEGKFKNKYGVIKSIQEKSAIVDVFAKSLVIAGLDNLTKICNLPFSQMKEGNYLLNGKVGEIVEVFNLDYFVVKYSDETKCYFWGQDDKLIQQFAIAPQHLIDQFLRESSATPTISPKKKKIASGSLAPYVENKKLKSGLIVTYPRVEGERDKFNHLHWKWGYYYEIKVDGEWKNRSLPTPSKIVPQVKLMIENRCSVDEIKEFILQCKNKTEKIVSADN